MHAHMPSVLCKPPGLGLELPSAVWESSAVTSKPPAGPCCGELRVETLVPSVRILPLLCQNCPFLELQDASRPPPACVKRSSPGFAAPPGLAAPAPWKLAPPSLG